MVLAVFNKAIRDYNYVRTEKETLSKEKTLTTEFEHLIQENFKHLTTVKEYAAKMNMTPKHLSQCVKKTTGNNALELINNTRIDYAKSLLLQTNVNVSEIAWELNFSETAYFFTTFKRLTGESPSDFRKKNLK